MGRNMKPSPALRRGLVLKTDFPDRRDFHRQMRMDPLKDTLARVPLRADVRVGASTGYDLKAFLCPASAPLCWENLTKFPS